MTVILFRRARSGDGGGRLHVGYRLSDWSDVYYEPIADTIDDDLTPELGLYCLATGLGVREPMSGEVAWHPPFAVAHHESTTRKEREELQRRTIYDAWRFCAARDTHALTTLQRELDPIRTPRWVTWYRHAKKWKKADLRARNARRARRTEVAENSGFALEEIAINSEPSDSESDEDSGFEEERARRASDRARKRGVKGGGRDGRGGRFGQSEGSEKVGGPAKRAKRDEESVVGSGVAGV